jgi:polysaccharide biosynthesis transport protein
MSSELQKVVETLPVTEDGQPQAASGQDQPVAPVSPVAPAALGAPVAVSLGRPLGGAAPANFNMMKFVHTALRGRYALAIILGLMTGALFAGLAWWLGKPVYQSEVLVRVRFNAPQIGAGGRADSSTPFTIVMASQKSLILSKRTAEVALSDPVWAGRPPQERETYFIKNLTVDMKAGSEFLRIIVDDDNPGRATLAVNSIANAYEYLYKFEEQKAEKARLGVLESRRSGLQTKIDALEKKLEKPAAEYGTTRLGGFYSAAAFELNKLQSTLTDIDLEVAMANAAARRAEREKAKAEASVDANVKSSPPAKMTAEQIGLVDPVMRRLLDEQDKQQARLDDLKTRGLGDSYPEVKAAAGVVAKATERVNRYQEAYNSMPKEALVRGPASNGTNRSLGELDAHRQSVAGLLEKMKENLRLLGPSYQLEELQGELTALIKQIDTIRDEEMLTGRMSIVSTGQEQLSPSRDPRPKYAAGAGVLGMCFPAGIIVLLSLSARRYRYSDEAYSDPATPNIPLLGILPELPTKHSECEEVLAAAHSVHQIRVSLEAQDSNNGSRAYLITSSTAGEGKTSLTMSLGLSFAAAGLRTLVIDCDLIGRHLTAAFRAKEMEGLQEALAAGSLRQFIRKTHGGLHLLTAGKGQTADACALPGAAMRSLLKEARRYFHVVLIDSGPILGSLEAAVLAREVDGVIFTITQGQQRRLVEHALRRLDSLGTRVAGLIFNRATRQDFYHSPFGSSPRSTSRIDSPASPREELKQLTDFGPLVHAVAGGLPAAHN